jgi:HlyD family secretion protein
MTATVTFVYAQKDDVIRLPNSALRFRPPPGMPRPSDERTGGVRAATPVDTSQAPDRRHGGGGGSPGETGRGAATSENDRSIWVLRDGKPLSVRVHTGVTDGTYTELVEGPVSQADLAITDATGPASKAQAASPGGRPPRLF